MRFGYSVREQSINTYPEIRDLTVKIEGLGFESIENLDKEILKIRKEISNLMSNKEI